MVMVGMAEEHVDHQGRGRAVSPGGRAALHELAAEPDDARAGIDHDQVAVHLHLDAGGVPADAHDFRIGARVAAPDTVKGDAELTAHIDDILRRLR